MNFVITFSVLFHKVQGLIGVGDHFFQLHARLAEGYANTALDIDLLTG